jgi:predicted dehydrogenase
VHVGSPNITGPGLQYTGQTAIICGSDGTLETRGDPWTVPPVSQITGLRRGSEQAETLVVPDDYYGGVDPADAFGVFRRQSVGPRLFIDSIIHDLTITPSFVDGHQVQRIIEAAVDSHLTGIAQTLRNPDDAKAEPQPEVEP